MISQFYNSNPQLTERFCSGIVFTDVIYSGGFMKKLLILTLLTLTTSAFASSTDQYKVMCSSKSIAADSVKEVIQSCVSLMNQNLRTCARSVSCRSYRTHCSAKSYAGDNVRAAIANCVTYGNHSERICAKSVSCQ
jgi:hypothetical protein